MLENDLVLYNPNYTKEVGIVKSIEGDHAFVQYNFGETYPSTNLEDLKVITKDELKEMLDSLRNKDFALSLL